MTPGPSHDIQLLDLRLPSKGGELALCIDCDQILEIVEACELSSLPHGTYPFIGLLTLRGQPIPVIELEVLVRQPDPLRSDSDRLVICQVDAGRVAVKAGGPMAIRLVTAADVEPLPSSLETHAGGIACTRIVRGKDERHSLVLDVNAAIEALVDTHRSRTDAAGRLDGQHETSHR